MQTVVSRCHLSWTLRFLQKKPVCPFMTVTQNLAYPTNIGIDGGNNSKKVSLLQGSSGPLKDSTRISSFL